MDHIRQNPSNAAFSNNPYPFYDRAREMGDIVWWDDYGLPIAVSHAAVSTILRDRRLGRAPLPEFAPEVPQHLRALYGIEEHSMLELEPPDHTRLRSSVLRAFTSSRISTMAPEISLLADQLIAVCPDGEFDLLPTFARRLPVLVIARLLGMPEETADQMLAWSNQMVAMYPVSYTHLTLPTNTVTCRSRWSPYH